MWTKRGWIRGALAAGAFAGMVAGCAEAPSQSGGACILCPDGNVTCGGPSTCLDSGTDTLSRCGVIPGYVVESTDCGGRTINGLRCVTGATWVLGPDASAEILDAGRIEMATGCTVGDGVVNVVNCTNCQ